MSEYTVGKAKYILELDSSNFKKGLSEADSATQQHVNKNKGKLAQASSDSESAMDRAKNGLSSLKGIAAGIGKAALVGVGAATAGIGALVAKSTSSFAEFEQLSGGIETLFGEKMYGTMMGYANQAYKTAGLSANEYLDTVTSFSASLLQGLKGNTEEAGKYANQAVIDMADNANKMGTSMGSIQQAYQGFAKQNYTMLDNLKLGYGGTASEMARLINDTGVMGSGFKATAKNMNEVPFNKIIEGIHKVQEKMGITGTTAKEASETISGSFNSLKAGYANLLTMMADVNGLSETSLKEVMDGMGDSASYLIGNLLPVVKQALKSLSTVLPEVLIYIVEGFSEILDDITGPMLNAITSLINAVLDKLPNLVEYILEPLLDAVIKVIDSMIDALPKLLDSLVKVLTASLPKIIKAIVRILPKLLEAINLIFLAIVEILSDPTVLKTLIEAFYELAVELLKAWVQGVKRNIKMIKNIIKNLVQVFTDPDVIKTILEGIGDALIAIFEGAVELIGELIGDFIAPIAQYFMELFEPITTPIQQAFEAVWNMIVGIWQNIVGIFNGIVEFIKQWGLTIVAIIFWPISLIVGLFYKFKDEITLALNILGDAIGFIFYKAKEKVTAVWDHVVQYFDDVYTGITLIFSGISDWFGRKFQEASDSIKRVFSGIRDFFASLWKGIIDIFSPVGTAVGNVFSGAVKGIVNPILGFAESAVNTFIDAINGAAKIINNIPNVHIPIVNRLDIPRLATGGIVSPNNGGSIIYAGDGGQNEWVVPESKMNSLIDKINQATSKGSTYNINVYGTFATSEREQRKVAQQIADKLEEIRRVRLYG